MRYEAMPTIIRIIRSRRWLDIFNGTIINTIDPMNNDFNSIGKKSLICSK